MSLKPGVDSNGRWPDHQPRRITVSHEKLCPGLALRLKSQTAVAPALG
jgi:hypothetical protein